MDMNRFPAMWWLKDWWCARKILYWTVNPDSQQTSDLFFFALFFFALFFFALSFFVFFFPCLKLPNTAPTVHGSIATFVLEKKKKRAPSVRVCLRRRRKDSGMNPWWGFWVQESSNKDKQNKASMVWLSTFISQRRMGSSSHKCCFAFEVLPSQTWLSIVFWKRLWNRPGDVLAGRCTPLVFRCLASGRFVRAVWCILWRCTLELFVAVILNHVQSSSCAQKPPLGSCPAAASLIISTRVCSDWYA